MTMIIEQLTQSWSGDEGDDPAMLLRSRSQFIRAFIERSDQEKQEKRRGWHFVRNVMSILTVHRQMVGESISGATRQVAGHPGAFLSSNGSLLKDFSEQEHTALQRLHADPLGSFAPQFFGVVDHNDRKYIKMQDVLLSMRRPHIMDMKMGTRTFIEEEASNSKLRKDLLQKALKLQKTHPDRVNLLPEELENGITKCRYLTLRDQISTSATLGFRIEGVLMSDGNALECNSLTDKEGVRKILKAFFESASSLQKQTILYRLLALRRTIVKSEFFRWSEVIGSSLLWVYDEVDLEKSGVWMIDFGKTIIARHELTHTRPWELGNQEDGYMVGLNNVILLMEELVDTPTVKEVQTQPDDAVNFRTGSLSEIRYVESSHSLKGNTSTPKVPEFSISSPEHSQYQEIPFISVESPHKEPVSSLRKETSANLSPKSVSFGRNEKPNPNTNERTMITPTTTTPTAPAPSAAIAPSPKPQAPLPLPIPPPAVSNKASSSPSLNENIMELKPCEKVLPRPTHIPPPAISNPQYSPSYNPNIHNANHSPPPSLPGSFINTPTHMPHITIPHPTSPHITRPNESQPSFQTPRANTHLETHMGTWSPQTNSNVSPNITPRPLDPRWISYSLQPYTTQHLINNLTQQQQQQQQQNEQHHQQQNNQGTSVWNQNNPQPNMTSPLPTVTLPYQHTTTSLLTNGTVISSVYPVHPYHTPYTTTTVISPAMTNYFPSNTSPPPTIITTTTSPLPIHTPPPVPPPQLPTSVSYYTELYQTRSMQRAPSPSPYSEPQLQHISPLKSPLVYHSSNDGERFGLADTKPMYTNRSISPNLVYQSNSPMSLHVIGASSSPYASPRAF